jgi:putative heme transporter
VIALAKVEAPDPRWKKILRWLRRGALLLVLFAVLDYLVLPQIAGTRKALHLLSSIHPVWAITGIVAEVASLVCYSMLTRSVFPDHRPHFSWLIRSDITALGVSHLLPGGAASSTGLRYRLLHEGGLPPQDTAVGMAVQGVGSTLVLAAMLWVSLIVSIPLLGFHPIYVTSAIVGAIIIAVIFLAIFVRSHSEEPSAGLVHAAIQRLLPRRWRGRVEQTFDAAAVQLSRLLADRRGLWISARWSVANWGLDAASLWVFLAAYGHRVNPDGLFVAYALANLLAVLPISPGGIGVIEGVLIPSLVGFGTPQAVAVLGVVSWRLFNFWAPIPAAGGCYLSLRVQIWVARRMHRVGSEAVPGL